LWYPIEQDFRVLHHDRCFGTGFDQGREILLSPWTVPSTNFIAVGSRPAVAGGYGGQMPGLRIPDPAPGSNAEARHGDKRQR
jgi:hypothetical protein